MLILVENTNSFLYVIFIWQCRKWLFPYSEMCSSVRGLEHVISSTNHTVVRHTDSHTMVKIFAKIYTVILFQGQYECCFPLFFFLHTVANILKKNGIFLFVIYLGLNMPYSFECQFHPPCQ